MKPAPLWICIGLAGAKAAGLRRPSINFTTGCSPCSTRQASSARARPRRGPRMRMAMSAVSVARDLHVDELSSNISRCLHPARAPRRGTREAQNRWCPQRGRCAQRLKFFAMALKPWFSCNDEVCHGTGSCRNTARSRSEHSQPILRSGVWCEAGCAFLDQQRFATAGSGVAGAHGHGKKSARMPGGDEGLEPLTM